MTAEPLFDYLPDPGAVRYCDCCGDPLTFQGGHYCAVCAAYACDCADWGQPFDLDAGPLIEDVPGCEKAGIT